MLTPIFLTLLSVLVRDIDYEQHLSKKPHTLTWTKAKCGSQENVS